MPPCSLRFHEMVLPILALGLLASPGRAATPDSLLEQGKALLVQKDATAAEAMLQECVRQDPTRASCWWELGWAFWLQRDWSRVLQAWERVQDLDPAYPELSEYLPRARDNAALEDLTAQAAQAAPDSFQDGPATGGSVRIRAVGDMMLGTDFPEGYLPPDDGAQMLSAVSALLADADLTFANLEGPLCDSGSTTKCGPDSSPGSCYAFRSPTRYGAYLARAGIDVVSTANNHSGDFGEQCRNQTEATLDALGIAHSGRPGDIASLEVNGLSMALVAFHTSSATHDLRDIATARSLVSSLANTHDIVFVSFHGGAEGSRALYVPQGSETFYGEDRGDLRAFTHAVVDAGADLVVGHGPHVLRGMEIYKGRLVAYSLGNFATYGRFNLSGNLGVGAILEATLGSDGRFLGGRILATIQEGRGVPRPDPHGRAIDLLRQLSAQDFPGTAVQLAKDGTFH